MDTGRKPKVSSIINQWETHVEVDPGFTGGTVCKLI